MEKNYEDQPDNSFFDDNKKTSFISFYCNKHFSYVILCWIIEILYRILSKYFSDYFSITKDIIINYYSIIILSSIADLLSVFIYLYVKYRSKSNRDEKIKKDEKKFNKLNRKSFRIKLIIICGLEYLGHSFHWIVHAIMYAIPGYNYSNISHMLPKDILCVFDVFMRFIFSRCILENVVYRHAKLSIIMVGIGFSLLLITDFMLIVERERNILHSLIFSIILLLRSIAYPYRDTLTKQIFKENQSLLPEKLQLLMGIIKFIIIILITPILYFSFGMELVWDCHPIVILTLSFYTILTLFKNYFILKIIYYFSSESVAFVSISECFALSTFGIIQIISSGNNKHILLLIPEILGIFIILFAALIYEEFIIINRCEFNKNVRKYIAHRANREIENNDVFNKEDIKIIGDKERIIQLDEKEDFGIGSIIVNDENY